MSDPEAELPRMSLPEHLTELRVRVVRSVLALFIAMFVAFFFKDQIWAFVLRPYQEAAALAGIDGARLHAFDPGEGFLQILKLCFLVGLVAAAPLILWQMWGFVAAGLYQHEQRTVRVFFPISIVLFFMGVVAAYRLLIPFGLRFLIGWNQDLGMETTFRISSYLSTCLTMVFAMGFLFELPLLMLFMQATDLVERKTLKKGWRWAVLLSFVVAMFLTDPSPITQIMMAIPVVGLYMLGVWGGRFVGEKAEQFRIWKAWPLMLGLGIYAALLIFADPLNDWAAEIFGSGSSPGAAAK